MAAEQRQGRVTHPEVLSTAGGRPTLFSPWKRMRLNNRRLIPNAQGLVEVETRAGEKLLFVE